MTAQEISLTVEEIQTLVEAGGMAPSGGNIQPWRVRSLPDRLELRLHPQRSDSFIDVGRLASLMALGSFAENVCVAAPALGLQHRVEVHGFTSLDEPVVSVHFTGRTDRQTHPHAAALEQRCTNRQPWDGAELGEGEIGALSDVIADLPGYDLHVCSGAEPKARAAEILGRADVVRMRHPVLHEQMFSEVRWSEAEARATGDGVDVRTLEVPTPAVWVMKMLSSRTIAGLVPTAALMAMTRDPITSCSHVCCLSMPSRPTATTMVATGQALERVWLEATRLGLALSPWAVAPFFAFRALYFDGEGFSEEENATMRGVDGGLRELLDVPESADPAFVFRLSRAAPPSTRSFRLPWEDYTELTQN